MSWPVAVDSLSPLAKSHPGALFLSRITGGAITEEEAREILRGFGDLEKVWVSSDTDKEMYRLPDGIWVQFAYFQDCRDAQMVTTACTVL